MPEQGPPRGDPSDWSDDPEAYLARHVEVNRQRLLRLGFMFAIPYEEREAVLQDATVRAIKRLRERTDHITSFEGWFHNLLWSVADHHRRRTTLADPHDQAAPTPKRSAFDPDPPKPARVRRELLTDPADLSTSMAPSAGDDAVADLEVGGLLEARVSLFGRCRNAVAAADLASPDVKARRRSANTERDLRVLAAATVAFFTALEREDTPEAEFTSPEASPVLAKVCLRRAVQPHYADQPDARDKYLDRNEADAYFSIGVCIRTVIGPRDPAAQDADVTAPPAGADHTAIVRLGAWRMLRVLQRSCLKPLVERLGGFITAKDPTGRPRFDACRQWLDHLLSWLERSGDAERLTAAVDEAVAWLEAPGTTQAAPIELARNQIAEAGPRRAEAEHLVAIEAKLHAFLEERAA